MAMTATTSDILANLELLKSDSSITINGYGDPESGIDFISVHNDIMKVTVMVYRKTMMHCGKELANPNYGFAEAVARFLKVPGAIASIDSKQLNWKYKVNLNEETFSAIKVIEAMVRGRVLFERMKSLFNTPLEDIG